MNAQAKLLHCNQQYAAVAQTEGGLRLQIISLDRDTRDLSNQLDQLLNQGEDVNPALSELAGLLSERSVVLAQYSEIASECAALCRQSAEAIKQLAR